MSASLFLVSMYLILDVGAQIDSIKWPVKSNPVTVDPLIRISAFHRKSFPSDNTAGVFSRTFMIKNISNSLTYTIAS